MEECVRLEKLILEYVGSINANVINKRSFMKNLIEEIQYQFEMLTRWMREQKLRLFGVSKRFYCPSINFFNNSLDLVWSSKRFIFLTFRAVDKYRY